MYADVSIVIPCYNHNLELQNALRSISRLEIRPLKVIVVDDGSEEPVSIVSAYDINLDLIRQKNKGLAGARNTGLAQVQSQWVLFLDADDELLPSALNFLPDNSAIDVVCSAYVLNKQGVDSVIYPQMGDPIASLLRSNVGPPVSFVFRTNKVKHFRFNEVAELRKGHEDYDLLCRLALSNAIFSSLHMPTGRYIKREGSMSSDTLNMAESRVAVWCPFFLQLRNHHDTYLLAAFSFLSEHWNDILTFRPAVLTDIINKLNRMIKEYTSSFLDYDHLFNKLPKDLRDRLLPLSIEPSNSIVRVEVANEIFDWRGRQYQKMVTYERFIRLLRKFSPHDVKGIFLIGANDLAETVLQPMKTLFRVHVIDDTKAGNSFFSSTIFPWRTIFFEDEFIFFIASYAGYQSVKERLIAEGVKEERII